MFSLFRKKKFSDFSFLHTDIHSHLIPGIDDGAKSVNESIELIRGLMDLGYKKIITTPHIKTGSFPNSPENILDGLQKVKTELLKNNINIEIEASAEYFLDESFFELVKQNKPLLTFGNNLLLFELSMLQSPAYLQDFIFLLQTKKIQPLLAHPERYPYLSGNFEFLEKLRSLGVKLIINIGSFGAYYGHGPQKMAQELMHRNMIDFLASDLHHQKHLKVLRDALPNLEPRLLRNLSNSSV